MLDLKIGKQLNNQRGNALVMVMFSVMAVVGLTYLTIAQKKQLIVNERVESSDRDIDLAVSIIGSIFLSPSNCNANLSGKAQAYTETALTQVDVCTAPGTCYGGAGIDAGRRIPVFVATAEGPTNWGQQNTKLGDSVRLVGITYKIITPQATGPTNKKAAIVEIKLKLQKKMGTTIKSGAAVENTRILERTVEAFAVTGIFKYPAPPTSPYLENHPSNRIYGCAKAGASTIAHGAP